MVPARRKWLRRLALLLFGSTLGLGAAEVVLRLAWASPSRQPSHHQLACRYDPLYGWSKVPGLEAERVTREYRVRERFNSKGLRGPEVPYEKPRDEYRILVLGDSSAEGYSVEFEQTLPELLARGLATRTGRPVTAINAGTGGWSTDQELLWFETEGAKYRPDLTLLLFHDNDVFYNGRECYTERACKPRFVLGADGELTLTSVPPPRRPGPSRTPAVGLSVTPLERAKDFLYRHSYVAEAARDAVRSSPALHRRALALGLGRPLGAAGRISMPDEFLVYRKDEPEEIAGAWRLTEALIARLERGAVAAGSRLLVFYVPTQEWLYTDRWEKRLAAFRLDPALWDVGIPGRRLGEACARRGLELVDPQRLRTAASSAFAQGGGRFNYEMDGHWTPAGHRAAAEVLQSNHLVERLRTPRELVP